LARSPRFHSHSLVLLATVLRLQTFFTLLSPFLTLVYILNTKLASRIYFFFSSRSNLDARPYFLTTFVPKSFSQFWLLLTSPVVLSIKTVRTLPQTSLRGRIRRVSWELVTSRSSAPSFHFLLLSDFHRCSFSFLLRSLCAGDPLAIREREWMGSMFGGVAAFNNPYPSQNMDGPQTGCKMRLLNALSRLSCLSDGSKASQTSPASQRVLKPGQLVAPPRPLSEPFDPPNPTFG